MPRGGRITIETRSRSFDEHYSRLHPPHKAGAVPGAVGDRHGHGNDARRRRASVRAVLHDQGTGQRHRTRAGHRLRHSSAGRRLCDRRDDARTSVPRFVSICRRSSGSSRSHQRRRNRRHPLAARPCCSSRTKTPCGGSRGSLSNGMATPSSKPPAARKRSSLSETLPGTIDVLVTDVVMAGMHGGEVSERLRASRPNAEGPVHERLQRRRGRAQRTRGGPDVIPAETLRLQNSRDANSRGAGRRA